jgi:hypothetical protein
VQALGIAACGEQLLAQVAVLGAQALAQRNELGDLGFERAELSVHACKLPLNLGTMLQISSIVKQ